MRTNARAEDTRTDPTTRLAGGLGARAARQDDAALLRRVVLANLLWENVAYEDGELIAQKIVALVPRVAPDEVAAIAREARVQQKLRHVPLMLARECARHESHRHVVDDLLADVVQRPDELAEFLSLYWEGGDRRASGQKLASGVKRGLARAFGKFDAYQLAKYDRETQVKLSDVLFMVHPKPADGVQASVWHDLAEGTLRAPDTWEVALSGGADKRETWTRLLTDNKLGELALLKNVRNIEAVGVEPAIVRAALAGVTGGRLLPLNFFTAAKHSKTYTPEIEQAMLRSLSSGVKLPGTTHLIVDVSGSMGVPISSRSEFYRLDAAAAMAVLAREACEYVQIWATAGDDRTRTHRTTLVSPHRGFALVDEIWRVAVGLGGGGIFTRQALDYVKQHAVEAGDRTIVFSDSQDCDWPDKRVPQPFSDKNYVIDVSANARGVAYRGVWDAEVSGWSEHFLSFIAALEGPGLQ